MLPSLLQVNIHHAAPITIAATNTAAA